MFGTHFQCRPARLFKDVLACLFIVALIAPAVSPAPQEPQENIYPRKELPVTRLVVTFGSNTMPISNGAIRDELRLVIRDRQAWASIWKRLLSNIPSLPPLPEIDFSREMLVVVSMGSRPDSGYRIIVNSARELRTRVEVEVVSSGPCGLMLGIETAPVDIVRIPKTDFPVTFREVETKCERK